MTNYKELKIYTDLLKRSLKYTQWPTYQPFNRPYYYDNIKEVLIADGSLLKKVMRCALVLLQKFLLKKNISLFESVGFIEREWHPLAHTMVSWERLENIENLMICLHEKDIKGDYLEAGVWRGGSSILMAGIEKFLGNNSKRIFVADSFEGLPKPNDELYPDDQGDILHQHNFLAISLETVKDNFNRYGLLSDNVVFLKGFFKDSLPFAPIDQLSLLRIDADMYEGTIQVLNSLYDKVTIGGFIIIDDYGAIPDQCGKATDEFRKKRGITSPLIHVDYSAVYWEKL